MNQLIKFRRECVLERLNLQLKTKMKTSKKSFNKEPLSDKDIVRIKSEIKTLQMRIAY